MSRGASVVTLYYGCSRQQWEGFKRDGFPPDMDYYWSADGKELPVSGIRLTRGPGSWSDRTLCAMLFAIDIPEDALPGRRVAWDEEESYDLPVDMVNAAPRRCVRALHGSGECPQCDKAPGPTRSVYVATGYDADGPTYRRWELCEKCLTRWPLGEIRGEDRFLELLEPAEMYDLEPEDKPSDPYAPLSEDVVTEAVLNAYRVVTPIHAESNP